MTDVEPAVGKKVFSIIEIAAICHEINRIYSKYLNEAVPSWIDAPGDHKESMISGVRFTVNNPDLTPKDQHSNWMQEKAARGWKYGRVKSDELKTHPCLVPYELLSVDQRRKDYIFQALVRILSQSTFEDPGLYPADEVNSDQLNIPPEMSPEMERYISCLSNLLPDLYEEEEE